MKIGDFGISKRTQEGTGFQTFNGTPGFLAPEFIVKAGIVPDAKGFGDKKEYTFAVDVWALGEIIHRILSGTSPFFESSASFTSYIKGSIPFPLEALKKEGVTDQGCDLVIQLMKLFPEERITAAKALTHQWIANQGESTIEASDEFPEYVHLISI